MAAVLSADMHNTDKVVTLIEEVRTMKLRLDAPDVNTSEFKFTVNDEGRIVYGLGAIKGVGEGPVEAITEARQAAVQGPVRLLRPGRPQAHQQTHPRRLDPQRRAGPSRPVLPR
jgi:DNA polymerase III alpha subunit